MYPTEWISVREKLSPAHEQVVVLVGDNLQMAFGRFDPTSGWTVISANPDIREMSVYYWIRLPPSNQLTWDGSEQKIS